MSEETDNEKYEKHFENNSEKYEKHYDEGKFKKMIKSLPRKISEPFVRLFYVMKHPNIDSTSKFFCIAALGYVVMTFDLIPDFISVIGLIDDLIVVGFTLKKLYTWARSDWVNEKVKEFYGDKKISLLD